MKIPYQAKRIFNIALPAISAALSVFLSRAFGAKDLERSKSVIFHGVLLTIIIGVLFSIVSVLFAESLLEWSVQMKN